MSERERKRERERMPKEGRMRISLNGKKSGENAEVICVTNKPVYIWPAACIRPGVTSVFACVPMGVGLSVGSARPAQC